jgi:hypothetical protein
MRMRRRRAVPARAFADSGSARRKKFLDGMLDSLDHIAAAVDRQHLLLTTIENVCKFPWVLIVLDCQFLRFFVNLELASR